MHHFSLFLFLVDIYKTYQQNTQFVKPENLGVLHEMKRIGILAITICSLFLISVGCFFHPYKQENSIQAVQPSTEIRFDELNTETMTATESQSIILNLKPEFLNVLNYDEAIYCYDFQKAMTLREYCDAFPIPVKLNKIAVIDLDQDNIDEAVLRVNISPDNDYGSLVLHWENDSIKGYTFSYRQLRDIKEDGTVTWSSSSSYHGISKLIFNHGEVVYNNLLWVEENNDKGVFFYNNEEITESDFWMHYSDHDSRKDVEWIPYPLSGSQDFILEENNIANGADKSAP